MSRQNSNSELIAGNYGNSSELLIRNYGGISELKPRNPACIAVNSAKFGNSAMDKGISNAEIGEYSPMLLPQKLLVIPALLWL